MTRSTWEIHDVSSDEHDHIYVGEFHWYSGIDKFVRIRAYLATLKSTGTCPSINIMICLRVYQYVCVPLKASLKRTEQSIVNSEVRERIPMWILVYKLSRPASNTL